MERAEKCGVAVEVELGRLEGGEAGLRMISDAKLTRPEKAREFMEGYDAASWVPVCMRAHLLNNLGRLSTGARILAPSIGNLHGAYLNPPNFRQDMYVLLVMVIGRHEFDHLHSLKDLQDTFKGSIPLCLHGTDQLPDELFQECIKNGISKVGIFPTCVKLPAR